VNGVPFALTGVQGHPLDGGAMCPVGLAAHHMPYHPLRLNGPQRFESKSPDSPLTPVSLSDAIAKIRTELAAAMASGGTVAVLDQRPGRAISDLYKSFLGGFPSHRYIVPPTGVDETIMSLGELSMGALPDAGFDFEHTRAVVSFGAPLLDGWGNAGRMQAIFGDRSAQGRKLIQIESHRSRTARSADLWLPIRPGTEAAVALSIANVIIRESLYAPSIEKAFPDFNAYREIVMRYHPHPVSALAGVTPDAIVQTARALAAGPSIALAGNDPAAGPLPRATSAIIAGLNLLCGNVGREGGIVYRQATPVATSPLLPATRLQDVPDHSISVLIMDAAESGDAFPAPLLEQKLVTGRSVVVLLSPTITSRSAMADYLIPTASAFEGWEELPSAPGSPVTSFAIASPLLPAQAATVDPVAFVNGIASSSDPGVKNAEGLLRRKTDELFAGKSGSLVSAPGFARTPVASVASADEMWSALVAGGCWIGDASAVAPKSLHCVLVQAGAEASITDAARPVKQREGGVVLEPFGMRAALSSGSVSPIMSKIFQETNLRALGGMVLLNPATAAAAGIADRSTVLVKTAQGSMKAQILIDATVMPGVARAAVGPFPNKTSADTELQATGVFALCTIRPDGSWRHTEATIEKV
jgi:anaerobic selenocysteine-containing dehydrogenase